MTKQWIAEFSGHQIRVMNSWFGGAKLYVDGMCCDTNKQLFAISGTIPRLSTAIPGSDGRNHVVEVFFVAIVTVKAKIYINGKQIAGDAF